MRDDVEAFQRFFELADLCRLPTIGGWTRKVQEMEQHVAKGGKINEAGTFFVQASRGSSSAEDRVIDFFRCLPKDKRGSALVIAYYCSPPMLEEYPSLVYHLQHMGVHADGESWTWSKSLRQSAGEYQKHFWKRVQAKRLVRRQ